MAEDAPLRFIHAADLHLQSPFVGLRSQLPNAIAREMVEAPFGAWDDIVDLAIRESVEAVLMAGDAYDDAERSLRAQHRFVAGLERLDEAGIATHVICGNHDPLDGWDAGLEFPGGCKRYGPDLESAPLVPGRPDRATVYGVSFLHEHCRRNLAREFPRIERGQLAIGLLHCAVGDDPGEDGYAPCSLTDLQGSGIAYWALGHVHRSRVLLDGNPVAIYAGCPQGLRWSQTGPKGVYLVEIDRAGEVRFEFVATDRVRMEVLSHDVATAETPAQLLAELQAAAKAAAAQTGGRPLLYRVVLEGRGPLHGHLQSAGAAAELADELNSRPGDGPFSWCDRVEVDTAAPRDRARRRAGGDLIADLLAVCDQLAAAESGLPRMEEALDELYGNADYRPYLAGPGCWAEDPAGLIESAENRALDLLEE